MDKIYQRAEDKNVAKILIYVSESESTNYAYKDVDCTIRMTADELFNACVKGALSVVNGEYMIPIAFSKNDEGFTSAKVTDCSTTTTTLYSSEYNAS